MTFRDATPNEIRSLFWNKHQTYDLSITVWVEAGNDTVPVHINARALGRGQRYFAYFFGGDVQVTRGGNLHTDRLEICYFERHDWEAVDIRLGARGDVLRIWADALERTRA